MCNEMKEMNFMNLAGVRGLCMTQATGADFGDKSYLAYSLLFRVGGCYQEVWSDRAVSYIFLAWAKIGRLLESGELNCKCRI